MQRIETFSHQEIAFVQYLQKLLDDAGIECVIQNENVGLVGLVERAALDLMPELWVLDDTRAEEAAEMVREVKAQEDESKV
jgi:hypothetical protein